MATRSFDPSGEASSALRTIVSKYGPKALSNPQKLASLLNELPPDLQAEKSVLVAAAEAGVADKLRDLLMAGIDVSTAIRLTAGSLEERTPLSHDASLWAVTALAVALGFDHSPSATATESAPPPVPPPDEASEPEYGYRPPPREPASVRPEKQPPKSPGSARSESGRRQSGRRRPQAKQADDPVSRAVRAAVRPGLLAFNPPAEMNQGQKERVEVGIARSSELRQALAAGLRGRGEPQFEEVNTSPFMGVELKGTAFEITPFSPLEQLVAPLARWEFDVTPHRAGHQTLALCISLRIDPISSELTYGGRIAVPVLEREIHIRVDVAYGTRRFLAANWQWLIVTAAGLGGGLAAWITLFH
jgi:hypothetical protein